MARSRLTLALLLLLVLTLCVLPLSSVQAADADTDEVEDDEVDEVDVEDDFIDPLDEPAASPRARRAGAAGGDRTKLQAAHPQVVTFVHFPAHPNMSVGSGNTTGGQWVLPAGEETVVLIGVSNTTPDVAFNVSHIGASLHSYYDHSYYVQNFTVKQMEAIVGPGQETTIEYRFVPAADLEPVDFQLTAFIIYNSTQGYTHQAQLFNETVVLLEHIEPWTVASVISYTLVVGALGVIGYAAYMAFFQSPSAKKKEQRRRAVPITKAEQEVVAKSWEPQIYTPATKAKVVRRLSSKKGSKKDDEADTGSKKKGSRKSSKKE